MEAKIIDRFKNSFGIELSKVKGKKILFEGKLQNGNSFIVATPKSKEYKEGYGWVDFTEVQLDLFKEYDYAFALFCIILHYFALFCIILHWQCWH